LRYTETTVRAGRGNGERGARVATIVEEANDERGVLATRKMVTVTTVIKRDTDICHFRQCRHRLRHCLQLRHHHLVAKGRKEIEKNTM